MLREQGGGGGLSIVKTILRKTIKEQFKLNIKINQKKKPWSKSTSTIRILQPIIDASIY